MVNIAIIDQNKTYRESLKTVLGQIEGFRVVLELSEASWERIATEIPVQLMIIDGSIGREKCTELIKKASSNGFQVRTLILAMFREELEYDYGKATVMLKSSGKREFAERIKRLLDDQDDKPVEQTAY